MIDRLPLETKHCITCGCSIPNRKIKYCSVCGKKARIKAQSTYHTTYDHNLRTSVLRLLGGECKRCGMTDVRVLQIDHINGNGYKERIEQNYDGGNTHYYYKHILEVNGDGYQLLCANCNWIKRYEQHEQN